MNLHISYLPFNRGPSEFLVIFDDTEKGVSIHLVDGGIDTGPILFKKVALSKYLSPNLTDSLSRNRRSFYRKSRSNNRAKLGVPTPARGRQFSQEK